MEYFTFYIRDSRYSVPTVEFMILADHARARELAAERLAQSPHHIAVEVFRADVMLFRLSKA